MAGWKALESIIEYRHVILGADCVVGKSERLWVCSSLNGLATVDEVWSRLSNSILERSRDIVRGSEGQCEAEYTAIAFPQPFLEPIFPSSKAGVTEESVNEQRIDDDDRSRNYRGEDVQ